MWACVLRTCTCVCYWERSPCWLPPDTSSSWLDRVCEAEWHNFLHLREVNPSGKAVLYTCGHIWQFNLNSKANVNKHQWPLQLQRVCPTCVSHLCVPPVCLNVVNLRLAVNLRALVWGWLLFWVLDCCLFTFPLVWVVSIRMPLTVNAAVSQMMWVAGCERCREINWFNLPSYSRSW